MKHTSFANELSLLKLAHTTLLLNFPQANIQKAFGCLVYEKMKRMGVPFFLFMEFGKILFTGNIPDFVSDTDIKKAYAILKKKYKVYKSLSSPKVVYKYLFLLELAYILKLGHIKYDTSLFAEPYKTLKINQRQQQILEEYINLMESGKTVESSMLLKDKQLKKNEATVHPLTAFINNENSYYNLKQRNISVFSTMSAGKSSFINALLGHDYLPSKNEACTAKIASIADTDYIDYCLGYAVKNRKPVFCGKVDQRKVLEWNNDSEVTEIILEGNLDRISSEKRVTVIHDTPGINYSGNKEHQKITLEHLVNSKPEIIICLLDATQMFTTDFSEAIENLKKANDAGSRAKVLFAINKADCYDAEKENLGGMAVDTVEHLGKYGFENPLMVPVSARAARLFKMALHGRTNFTENEIDDFTHYLKFFQRSENNFVLFANGCEQTQITNREYTVPGASEILIEGKPYKRAAILNAFFCTGIPLVENILTAEKRGC